MKLKFLTTQEMQKKKTNELETYVIEMKTSLAVLQREIARNQDNKTHQISLVRKTIARAKTVQTAHINGKGKES